MANRDTFQVEPHFMQKKNQKLQAKKEQVFEVNRFHVFPTAFSFHILQTTLPFSCSFDNFYTKHNKKFRIKMQFFLERFVNMNPSNEYDHIRANVEQNLTF